MLVLSAPREVRAGIQVQQPLKCCLVELSPDACLRQVDAGARGCIACVRCRCKHAASSTAQLQKGEGACSVGGEFPVACQPSPIHVHMFFVCSCANSIGQGELLGCWPVGVLAVVVVGRPC